MPATAPRRSAAGYGSPRGYAELIEPRYARIADQLVAAASPQPSDDVLELGAGTGLVTRRVADTVGSLVATDVSPNMLELARQAGVTCALVDYTKALPFLDASFDLVLSGLTFVQDAAERVRELARVLRPGGRFALAMWGPNYHELRLLSDAVQSIGRPPIPKPNPGRVVRRLEECGFDGVRRHDFDLENTFGVVGDYISYRRGFGIPPGATQTLYRRYLRAIERRAGRDAAPDGSLKIGWTVSVITATRNLPDEVRRARRP